MEITITLSDESVQELAEAIASKITVNGAEPAEVEDDFAGGATEPEEVTLTTVQDAIKEAIGTFGKEKVKAAVKKIAGVDMVKDIDKAKYQAVLDGMKKLKK